MKVSNKLRYDKISCVPKPKPKKVTVRAVADKGITHVRIRKTGQSGWTTVISSHGDSGWVDISHLLTDQDHDQIQVHSQIKKYGLFGRSRRRAHF